MVWGLMTVPASEAWLTQKEMPDLHKGNVDGQNHPVAGHHPGYASRSGPTQGQGVIRFRMKFSWCKGEEPVGGGRHDQCQPRSAAASSDLTESSGSSDVLAERAALAAADPREKASQAPLDSAISRSPYQQRSVGPGMDRTPIGSRIAFS